jgi:hypothetical protein
MRRSRVTSSGRISTSPNAADVDAVDAVDALSSLVTAVDLVLADAMFENKDTECKEKKKLN